MISLAQRLAYRPCLFGLALALVLAPAAAFNYVADSNGTWWGIQDASPPRVDTGSIRATQVGAGLAGAYSTSINGFGGIRVSVSAKPEPRFNGEIMRGFGLTFDGRNRFTTTQSVNLGGVKISRSIYINQAENWGRWLDSFTNTTRSSISVKVAFGGQSGYGIAGANASAIVNTSNGDKLVTPADSWVEVATPLADATLVGGPQITVLGTPDIAAKPFSGAMAFAGNWLTDPFSKPLAYSGHEVNFQAYVNNLTLKPGRTRSLLHFIVLGGRVNASTSPAIRAALERTATRLSTTPAIGDLSASEICSIDNFDHSALAAASSSLKCLEEMEAIPQPPAPKTPSTRTSVKYSVVAKTIAQLRTDLQHGVVTSVEITQAYLDRIAAYDQGQFGFNAYEIIAQDALAQARAADRARALNDQRPLLGIPIAVKNLYDTFDMPTTNGSLTFAGFRPMRDAFQVAQLRKAGAVIIGKTALEEYATSGNYSNDAWGQVWNVFQPSRSAIASSGGSASAVAASMAAAALGSQTGDSLYGPASAASLVTLRGTDGLESGTGVMPLVYLTDFGGVIARSAPDLADVLNVVVAVDPADPETSVSGRHTPADWRSALDPNALRGKRIGFIPSTWVDPLGTTNTIAAEKAALRYFELAGATIVEMGVTVGGTDTPPAPNPPPGDIRAEGWGHYIDTHPELVAQGFKIATHVDVDCSQKKVAYVRAGPVPVPLRLRRA
jgi:amidase